MIFSGEYVFVGIQQGAYPQSALLANSRIGWMNFPRTNTLAYFIIIGERKIIIILRPDVNVTKSVSSSLTLGQNKLECFLKVFSDECMFVRRRQGAYPQSALLTNSRIGWMNFPRTNTLAYFIIIGERKIIITLTPDVNVTKCFSSSLTLRQNKL
jgi:hypothetical protein